MTPAVRAYVHAGTDPAVERERLALLEERYDRETFRRIGALGPLSGASALEVGAGAGSVARWLARAVGPGGRVVATDIDTRFLDGLAGPNLEIRRHDILVDPLPAGAFDLVHCRALLFHLGDPERALARMVGALRPGGWLVVEDADYVSCVAATPAHPHAGAFGRTVAGVMARAEARNLFDPWVGRRLAAMVGGLGLGDLGAEGLVFTRSGGSGPAELFVRSTTPGRAEVTEEGYVSATDYAAALKALADPAFRFLDAISFASWGRR